MYSIARQIVVALLGTILPSLLAAILLSAAAWTALGSNERVKSWLDRSGSYNTVVSVLLSESNRNLNQNENALPTDNPEIQAIFVEAFPSSLIRSNAELFIDGTYRWLDSTTSTPQYTIDVATAKQSLGEKLGVYVEKRLSGLPICTNQAWTTVNVFTIDCRPQSLSPEDAKDDIVVSIAEDETFLGDGALSAEEISFNGATGQPYYEQLSSLPSIYSSLGLASWVFAGAAVIVAVIMMAMSPDRQKTARRLAFLAMFSGTIAILFGLLGTTISGTVRKAFISGSSGSLVVEKIISPIIEQASSDVAKTALYYGAAYLTIGIVIGLLSLDRHKKIKKQAAQQAMRQQGATPPQQVAMQDPIAATGVIGTPPVETGGQVVSAPTYKTQEISATKPPRLIQ